MELIYEIDGKDTEIANKWLCGHGDSENTKGFLVQASERGLYHWICDKCYYQGTYYCQRVTWPVDDPDCPGCLVQC